MDPAKSLDASVLMEVVGIETDINWTRRRVRTCVAQAKATKWCKYLAEILEIQRASADVASRIAGRLYVAVSTAPNRVGRGLCEAILCAGERTITRGQV